MQPKCPAGLAQPKTTGVNVSDWEDTKAPKLNGDPIALRDLRNSRSLAIAPDASRFVLGTDWSLRAYRANGSELWQKPVPGTAWGVNISRDGKLVVAAYGDGTIRWHRLSDGQELLALFVHAKDRRFIAWTPKGYYAASPGGENLIGWQSIAAGTGRRISIQSRAFATNLTGPISSSACSTILTKTRP